MGRDPSPDRFQKRSKNYVHSNGSFGCYRRRRIRRVYFDRRAITPRNRRDDHRAIESTREPRSERPVIEIIRSTPYLADESINSRRRVPTSKPIDFGLHLAVIGDHRVLRRFFETRLMIKDSPQNVRSVGFSLWTRDFQIPRIESRHPSSTITCHRLSDSKPALA